MELTRQDAERLANIIGLPRVTRQIKEFVGPNEEMIGRLAHYTTAESALEIIKSFFMNDRTHSSLHVYQLRKRGCDNLS